MLIQRVHKRVASGLCIARWQGRSPKSDGVRTEKVPFKRRMETIRRRYAIWLLVSAICFSPAQAAPTGTNIAGNYRGLLTTCLAARQPDLCREGLLKLVGSAEQVDSKRAKWEAVENQADPETKDGLYREYFKDLDSLNEAIVSFNQAMQRN